MIGAIGLDVSIILIEAQINLSGKRLVPPAGAAVVLPVLRRARVERHTVQGDTETHPAPHRHRPVRRNRVHRHPVGMALGRNRIGVSPVRKCADIMLRYPVRPDYPHIAISTDTDVVFMCPGAPCCRQGRRRRGKKAHHRQCITIRFGRHLAS